MKNNTEHTVRQYEEYIFFEDKEQKGVFSFGHLDKPEPKGRDYFFRIGDLILPCTKIEAKQIAENILFNVDNKPDYSDYKPGK